MLINLYVCITKSLVINHLYFKLYVIKIINEQCACFPRIVLKLGSNFADTTACISIFLLSFDKYFDIVTTENTTSYK